MGFKPLIKFRGTTFLKAFLLNAFFVGFIAALSVEFRRMVDRHEFTAEFCPCCCNTSNAWAFIECRNAFICSLVILSKPNILFLLIASFKYLAFMHPKRKCATCAGLQCLYDIR